MVQDRCEGNPDLVCGYDIALHMWIVPAPPRDAAELMGPLTADCAAHQLHLSASFGIIVPIKYDPFKVTSSR